MKRSFFVLLLILVIISFAFNLFLLLTRNNDTIIYSPDNRFAVNIIKTKEFKSIRVLATENNVTLQSTKGEMEFCSLHMHPNRFSLDIYWSTDSSNVFVLSSDIGVTCIHYDETLEVWDEYWCDLSDEKDVLLRKLDSDEVYGTISRDIVPKEIYVYLVNLKTVSKTGDGSMS